MVTRTTCRSCDGPLASVLSLGEHFVSDFPDPSAPDGLRAPLELALCQRCWLLQLRHTVPAERLYRNYWYRSGTNASMRFALADLAQTSERLIHLRAGDAVLDIGCNDGTLLGSYQTPDIVRIGFDPAQNLTEYSRRVADVVLPTFFSAERFRGDPRLQGLVPRIVTSIAMFYDLEEPNQFVADISSVMDPEGLWVVQMSYLPSMLKQNAFDNICHEHLEYYSLQTMEFLLERHGLHVVDAELNDVNGGSFRLYIRRSDASTSSFADGTHQGLSEARLSRLREHEKALRLDDRITYDDFAFRVQRTRADVVEFVRREHARGKRILVYGASTKGNTLLQYFGIDHTTITAAAERNPDKWGKVTVGTRIPIVSEDEARRMAPDYFLVLPWHFLDEFMERERAFLRGGGRFIVPLPYFSLI
jgi:NDP-4-keto-2,6-dideoxyhexose 3-C-methyltransferase